MSEDKITNLFNRLLEDLFPCFDVVIQITTDNLQDESLTEEHRREFIQLLQELRKKVERLPETWIIGEYRSSMLDRINVALKDHQVPS